MKALTKQDIVNIQNLTFDRFKKRSLESVEWRFDFMKLLGRFSSQDTFTGKVKVVY